MADRKEFDIDGKPLSSLRVVDLKIELEKRGMSKSGSKKELSDRLKMQLQLEKLHESASTDEGHVPNLGLQDDEIAEHSDLIKDYLAKQQQIYEIQKEAIRRVELEEQRVRESSETSAGDTSQEEEDIESNLPKAADEPCAEDLSISKSKRKEEKEKKKEQRTTIDDEAEKKKEEQQKDMESGSAALSTESEIQEMIPDPEQKLIAPVVQSEKVLQEEKTTSDIAAAPLTDDSDETSRAIAQIEPVVEETPDAEKHMQMSTKEESVLEEPHDKKSKYEIDENAAAIDSIALEGHVAPEELVSLPESTVEMSPVKTPEKISKSNEETCETSKPLKSVDDPSVDESSVNQSKTSDLQDVQMEIITPKQSDENAAGKKESVSADKSSPKHKIKLKRPKLSSLRSALLEKEELVQATKTQNDEKSLQIESESPTQTTVRPRKIDEEDDASERSSEAKLPTKEDSKGAEMESHRLPSEAADSMKDHLGNDNLMQQSEEKKDEVNVKDGDTQTSTMKPSRLESPPRTRRRRRSTSTESSSNDSSSSPRSRPRYRRESSSSQSKSRSRSTSRDAVKGKLVASPSEESMETETNEDSVSRPFPKQDVGMDTEGEDKTADVDDSLSAADASQISEMPKDSKEVIDKLPEKEFPSRITSRKISLSSSKAKKEDNEGKENGAVEEEKPQRKRRWGGSSAVAAAVGKKLSLSISTDSLKGLIPDVKPLSTINSGLQEPLPEAPVEKPVAKQNDSIPAAKEERPTTPVTTPTSAPVNKRDLIIYRTVTQVVKDNTQTKLPEREASKGKLAKNSAPIGYNDDAGAARRSPSPPRYPPSCIIHIRNLVRPFTDILLKELLSRTGTLVQGGFWMDKIKSKCYATFETEEQAVATRHALHGIQWPYSNPKRLSVDFATQDELEFHRGLTDNPDLKKVVPAGRNASAPERVQKSPPPSRRKETAVMAATAAPAVRQHKDSQRSERDKDKDKEKKEPKHGVNRSQSDSRPDRGLGGRDREADRARGREREVASVQHQPPIREWDRDKIGEKSPGERARAARNRGRSPSSRSRSRTKLVRSPQPDGFGQGRERNREAAMRDRRDRKDVRRKDEEEAPAKLLDDLFHKTKTTPCIYWLPLTGDQAKVREEERKQRQVEREKRRQMEQTDNRDRTAGANVEQNRRNREGDNSRIRKRSESPARSRTRRR